MTIMMMVMVMVMTALGHDARPATTLPWLVPHSVKSGVASPLFSEVITGGEAKRRRDGQGRGRYHTSQS